MLATMLGVAPLPASAQESAQVGFRAHSHAGFGAEVGGPVTGEKPESKLWFHDGNWWAAMVDPAQAGAHTIHRLDATTWVSTGLVIDSRPSIKEDVLSLGNTLYVLSRADDAVGENQLARFTYASGSYSLDAGFPVDAPGTNAETTTLARDSLGNLWVSYEQSKKIYVARTEGSDSQWGTPFVIPVAGATGVLGDDISAVISFSDNAGPAIGVMWSNQNAHKVSFAVHRDGAADNAWTEETALSGNLEADDHINMKTADNQVFSVVKTSKDLADQELIRMLVRSPSGAWGAHRVALKSEDNTRPITMLHVDPIEDKAYVFMTMDSGRNAEGISYKVTSTDNISFPTQATVFIRGPNAEPINNATSMKANATAASGIVVMASDGSHYWWNQLGGEPGEPPANTAPSASDASASMSKDTAKTVTLTATDQEDCELTFSVVTPPANGSLSPLSDQTCSTGSPNSDSAEVTYTPNAGFTGTDSFSFKANDGELDSNSATVTITVTEPGAGGDIAFVAASSAANATATTLVIDRPTGVTAGDVLVATVSVRGKPQVTPPSGWTLVRSDVNGSALKLETYHRVAGSSEPASYTWTFPDARGAAGGIAAFSGVDTGAPIDASGGSVNASSTSVSAPSITTTVPDTMLLGSFAIRGTTALTPPSGMTERWDLASTGSSKITSAGATEARAPAGATGTRVATAADAAPSIGQLVALKPGGSSEPPANTAPSASDASASTSKDTAETVTLTATDQEDCELTFSVVTPPANGSLSPLTDQTCSTGSPNSDSAEVTYTPNAGFTGTDSFSFKANDGELDSNTATVTMTVTEPGTPPANTAPSAADGSTSTPQDTAVTVTLTATDQEDCELGFSVVDQPASGSLSALSDQTCSTGSPNSDSAEVTYTPNAGFTGTDSFSFKANDGELDSNSATVTITVTEPGAGGDIAFVAASSAANATATTLVIDRPTGVTAGDVLVATVSVRGKPQVTPPSGWTLVRSDVNGSTLKLETYYLVATSSEPSSYTWTFPDARGAAGGIAAFSGVDTGAPIDASGGSVNASSTSVSAPSITTTVPDTMLLGSFAIRGTTALAPPQGMTERWDLASTGSSKITSSGATEARPATGATGERVATAADAAPNIGHLVALRPAV